MHTPTFLRAMTLPRRITHNDLVELAHEITPPELVRLGSPEPFLTPSEAGIAPETTWLAVPALEATDAAAEPPSEDPPDAGGPPGAGGAPGSGVGPGAGGTPPLPTVGTITDTDCAGIVYVKLPGEGAVSAVASCGVGLALVRVYTFAVLPVVPAI